LALLPDVRELVQDVRGLLRHVLALLRDERALLHNERVLLHDERVILHDERVFPRDERVFPRDERVFPRDERAFPRDERALLRDEQAFPRDERALESQVVTKKAEPCGSAFGRRCGGLKTNAFKDWKMRMPKIFYPEGITEISPGSRSGSYDHPGLGNLLDWHPERRARNAVGTPDLHAFSDPLPGSNTLVNKVPRVFVAIAPHSGLISPIPAGIKNRAEKSES
jgi:hypothetical protein